MPSFDYPIKFGMTSDKDIENMNMMIEVEKGQKILIRGYIIEEQLRMREHSEINGDGVINIGFHKKLKTCLKMTIPLSRNYKKTKKCMSCCYGK